MKILTYVNTIALFLKKVAENNKPYYNKDCFKDFLKLGGV